MAVSYKKLWKLLIDRDIKKGELCRMAGISAASVTKMGNGGNVTADVLAKICVALKCSMDDIMEVLPDKEYPDLQSKTAELLLRVIVPSILSVVIKCHRANMYFLKKEKPQGAGIKSCFLRSQG